MRTGRCVGCGCRGEREGGWRGVSGACRRCRSASRASRLSTCAVFDQRPFTLEPHYGIPILTLPHWSPTMVYTNSHVSTLEPHYGIPILTFVIRLPCLQVPCRGKGQSPQPADVNRAVFELWNFRMWFPDRYALVHCTHGYNRTGEGQRGGAEMGRRGRGKRGLLHARL